MIERIARLEDREVPLYSTAFCERDCPVAGTVLIGDEWHRLTLEGRDFYVYLEGDSRKAGIMLSKTSGRTAPYILAVRTAAFSTAVWAVSSGFVLKPVYGTNMFRGDCKIIASAGLRKAKRLWLLPDGQDERLILMTNQGWWMHVSDLHFVNPLPPCFRVKPLEEPVFIGQSSSQT